MYSRISFGLSRQASQIDVVRNELLRRFAFFHSTFHSSAFFQSIPWRLNLSTFSYLASFFILQSYPSEWDPVWVKYLHTESPINLSLITQTSGNQAEALGSYYSRMWRFLRNNLMFSITSPSQKSLVAMGFNVVFVLWIFQTHRHEHFITDVLPWTLPSSWRYWFKCLWKFHRRVPVITADDDLIATQVFALISN